MPKYFADLNPDYPSKYEKRWAVFYRFDPAGPTVRAQPRYSLTFATRKAAERNAALLDRAEFDPFAEGPGTVTVFESRYDENDEARW